MERKGRIMDKTIIKVSDARYGMAVIACAISDYPAHKMTMIGITGTNGKTTTTWMLSHILIHCGKNQRPPSKIGTIGTIGPHINGEPCPTQMVSLRQSHPVYNVLFNTSHGCDCVHYGSVEYWVDDATSWQYSF